MSQGSWTLADLPSWVHAAAVAGPAGTTDVTVTVDRTTTVDTRQATLTISSGSYQATYTVTQEGDPWAAFSQLFEQLMSILAQLVAMLNGIFGAFGGWTS